MVRQGSCCSPWLLVSAYGESDSAVTLLSKWTDNKGRSECQTHSPRPSGSLLAHLGQGLANYCLGAKFCWKETCTGTRFRCCHGCFCATMQSWTVADKTTCAQGLTYLPSGPSRKSLLTPDWGHSSELKSGTPVFPRREVRIIPVELYCDIT